MLQLSALELPHSLRHLAATETRLWLEVSAEGQTCRHIGREACRAVSVSFGRPPKSCRPWQAIHTVFHTESGILPKRRSLPQRHLASARTGTCGVFPAKPR